MPVANPTDSIEQLELVYKTLTQKRDEKQREKDKIEAHRDAARKTLKDLLDKARKEGFDPDNLETEIKRYKEVLAVKLNTLDADLQEVEKIMKPMKQAIEGSSA